jgi:hypothetical protein
VDQLHELRADEWRVLFGLAPLPPYSGRRKMFTLVTSRNGQE